VAAVLENPMTYEVFVPEMVGESERSSLASTQAVKPQSVVEKMGYNLTHDQMSTLLDKVKKCSEAKRKVSCDRLTEFIKEIGSGHEKTGK